MIIQWERPLLDSDLQTILDIGGKLIGPLPTFAYLVTLPPEIAIEDKQIGLQGDAKNLASSLAVNQRWVGTLQRDWKLHPAVADTLNQRLAGSSLQAEGDPIKVQLQFAQAGDVRKTRNELAAASVNAHLYAQIGNTETWTLEINPATLVHLLDQNSVYWVEPYYERRLLGERDALAIVNPTQDSQVCVSGPFSTYAAWLNSIGLDGTGRIVNVMDDGLSQGIATNAPGTAHPDIIGRIVGIDNAVRNPNTGAGDPLGDGGGGHGHLNASIIMGRPIAGGGRVDSGGFLLGQGIAPGARVHATKIFSNQGGLFYTAFNPDTTLRELFRRASVAGATVSSNSWGADTFGQYNVDSQVFDAIARDADTLTPGNQAMTLVVAAGNSGSRGNRTIGAPATAKNIIAVGASENCDNGLLDGSLMGPSDSDDLRDIAVFSSRGPTSDGRLGVTVTATGVHVPGAASDSPNFDGNGVSGRDRSSLEPGEAPSATRYYPAFQTDYTWSSGTSHSTPIVAGTAVLFEQYFLQRFGVAPSPAMVRAALSGSTIDPVGGKLNRGGSLVPSIPNIHSGWGRVVLRDLFDGQVEQFMLDQTQVFTASGQTFTVDLELVNPDRPLRVVLSWTDAVPELSAATKLVNDLDLSVSFGTSTWKGNVFSGGSSMIGGTFDTLNNIEQVILPTPQQGNYSITVNARLLGGDALPASPGNLQQDFALYVFNATDVSPIGEVGFNAEVYTCDAQAGIVLADGDLVDQGTATVQVQDLGNGDSEIVTLTETSGLGGIFNGSVQLTANPVQQGDGLLSVAHGSRIRVTYFDATIGEGGQPLVATDEADLDCNPPQLDFFAAGKPTHDTIQMALGADEPMSFRVEYGLDCGNLTEFASTPDGDFSTAHTIALTPLETCSLYYYRLIATDRAGNESAFVDENCLAFQTFTRNFLLFENLEPQQLSWTTQANVGLSDWSVVEFAQAHSPTHVWRTRNTAERRDISLVSPPVTIVDELTMVFWHTYRFETVNATQGYDGGVIEITTNGGSSWTDLGPHIIEGGYNSQIIEIFGDNVLNGREAWSGGQIGPMSRVLVDLTDFVDKTVQVRFRMGTDEFGAGDGWYIDDISFEHPTICAGELTTLQFDAAAANCDSGLIRFQIADQSLSAAAAGIPTGFQLAGAGEFEGIPITPSGLQRIDDSGIWEGFLTVQPGSTIETMRIAGVRDFQSGESIRLIYRDDNVNGDERAVIADVQLDCVPPTLVSTQVFPRTAESATVRISTDEPVIVRLSIGLSCGNLNQVLVSSEPAVLTDFEVDGLVACQPYFYNVQITDPAGNTRLLDNQGLCYGFKSLQSLFTTDDMEPAADPGWTHDAVVGSDNWAVRVDNIAHSPSRVWSANAIDDLKDSSLVTPEFTLPADARLRFFHSYKFEYGFDGAVLEISTNNGASWIDLGPYIVTGDYDRTISLLYSSPIRGRSAWTGLGATGDYLSTDPRLPMTEVVVDLSEFEGPGRLIRFRLTSDRNTLRAANDGWYLDDISLETFANCEPLFPPAPLLTQPAQGSNLEFVSDLVLDWADVAGATRYRVYWGLTPETPIFLGEVTSSVATIPSAALKAGTEYYWSVVAVSNIGATPSAPQSFRTQAIPPARIAETLIGASPGLTAAERLASDYDQDGQITPADLVTNVNRQP